MSDKLGTCDACGQVVTTDLVHGGYVKRTEQRIAALERDRALLLRYVRAMHEIKRHMDHHSELSDEEWHSLLKEKTDAYAALIDAGLLEGAE